MNEFLLLFMKADQETRNEVYKILKSSKQNLEPHEEPEKKAPEPRSKSERQLDSCYRIDP